MDDSSAWVEVFLRLFTLGKACFEVLGGASKGCLGVVYGNVACDPVIYLGVKELFPYENLVTSLGEDDLAYNGVDANMKEVVIGWASSGLDFCF